MTDALPSRSLSGRRLRVVFYCGAESPFGLAYLGPVLTAPQIDVVGVVLATTARWTHFRHTLQGTRPIPAGVSSRGWRWLRSRLGRLRRVIRGDWSAIRTATSQGFRRCAAAAVPVLFEDDINAPAARDRIAAERPDLLFCAAYPQLFKETLLAVPLLGSVNFHPSLLPRYRGAHPIFWAIATGAKITGITAHYMTPRVDEGPVLSQIAVPILDADTYQTLYRRIVARVPESLTQTLTFLLEGHQPVPQDPERVTFFREDRDQDHRIVWTTRSVRGIVDLVRAADGRAFFYSRGQRVHVGECTIVSGASLPVDDGRGPGTILGTRHGLDIQATDGVVRLRVTRAWFGRAPRFEPGQVLN